MLPYPMSTQPQQEVAHEDYMGGAQPPQSIAPPTAVQEELEALWRTELSHDAAIRSARERTMALTRRSTTEALAGNIERGRQLLSTAYAANTRAVPAAAGNGASASTARRRRDASGNAAGMQGSAQPATCKRPDR